MGDHLVVQVDQLLKLEEAHEATVKKPEMVGSSSSVEEPGAKVVVVEEEENEEAPLIGVAECRICQDDDSLDNLESPCACSGSLKYAHRKCVQHWCNEKGDSTCEICHQPYQSGYTVPPRPHPDETSLDIRRVWQISGTHLDVNDPRLLAIADAERRFFEAEYDDYNSTSNGGAAFCRSAALILMALLLLRQALIVTDGSEGEGNGSEDASTFFSLFLLRVAGFLLPCYIMIWAISILQQRRQRQEAAALAAAQFAIVVQSAQNGRGLLVASAAPAVSTLATPHQEQV